MLSRIKWIVTDLDGTLIRDENHISEKTLQCLQECRRQGLSIAFVTARPLMRTAWITELFSPDLLIFSNGAGESIRGKLNNIIQVPPEVFNAVVRCYLEGKWVEKFVADGLEYRYTDSTELLKNMPHTARCSFSGTISSPILTLILWLKNETASEELAAYLPDASVIPMITKNRVIVSHPEATKTAALARFTRCEGLKPEEVLAFGDDWMDEGMLSMFIGVAMGNAASSVKNAARYETVTNTEDGVADFLYKNLVR